MVKVVTTENNGFFYDNIIIRVNNYTQKLQLITT